MNIKIKTKIFECVDWKNERKLLMKKLMTFSMFFFKIATCTYKHEKDKHS